MCTAFFSATQYPTLGLEIDPEEVAAFLVPFIDQRNAERMCILLTVDDVPRGILIAASTKNLFNKHKVTAEIAWWISPEYRGYKSARLMIDAYEYWAKNIVHAQVMQMVALDDSLDAMYRRKGFTKAELSYIKVL
jgi:RimJ/RimL family protein N-acetyltransferase